MSNMEEEYLPALKMYMNDIGDVDVEGEEYKETVPEKAPEKSKKEETPKTGSNSFIEFSAIAIAISSMAIIVLKRKDLSC